MEYDRLLRALNEALSAEMALFSTFSEEEEEFERAVLERDWVALEAKLRSMDRISLKIAGFEEERHRIFRSIVASLCLEDAGFYDVLASCVDSELREELAAGYRDLRYAVMKTKSVSGNIGAFLEASTGTLREILEELQPHRKGKLYTRKGSAKAIGETPLVVNHRL